MEMAWRHGNWLLREVAFVWTSCLLDINGSKTAAARIATGRKTAHLCQGVGEMGGGRVFVFWNGRAVRALRAPAGSTTSAPLQGSAPCPAALLHGCPRAGRAPGEGRTLVPKVPGCPGVAQPGRAGFALWFVKRHLKSSGLGFGLGQVGEVPGKCSPTHHPAVIASATFPKWTPPHVVVPCF